MNEVTENIVTEPVITAGEMLRNARTTGRRKREIPTVAKQLCIKEEFLQALEDCNYTAIPELVYVLGFARNYAIELGIDPDEIVAKIKSEMGVVQEGVSAAPGEYIPDGQQKKIDFKPMAKDMMSLLKKAWEYVAKHWKLFVTIGGVVVVLIFVLTILFSSNTGTQQTVSEEPVIEVVENMEPNYNIPVREYFGTENRAKAQVIIQAIEDSYVAVEDSKGKVVFGRSLVSGDVYYVPDGKLKAKFGNAGGIDIWVNGKLAPKIAQGHVAKSGVSLSPESLIKSNKK